MTPPDFQAHAERLLADGDPASCRSAVSRSYYAAHHAAVDFLVAVGVRYPQTGAAHAAFDSLRSAVDVDDDLVSIGQRLRQVHRHRNRADYYWAASVLETPDQAGIWVEIGRAVIESLDACLADQDRLDILYDHFREWVPQSDPALGLSLV